MAKDKKSFLLYADLLHTVSKMPTEKAGELFLHILKYVNDENPITEDLIIQLTFEPIKQSLKRDLDKYNKTCLRNSENALKRWNKENATASSGMRKDAKNADSDNDSDNGKDIKENNIDSRKLKFANTLKPFVSIYGKELIREFYDYWTEHNKSNTKFKQELQKTWGVELRLKKWSENNFNKKTTTKNQEYDIDELRKQFPDL
jgi:hypothetical protein